MFISSLEIENLRCFEKIKLDQLNIPNDDMGSGLNIFISENGNGKTTILEAINYLTQSKYSTENKLSSNDFNEPGSEIKVSFKCDNPVKCASR